MAQQNKPFTWPGFQGINLAGNPVNRPLGTARTCENYRVMPGGWLRLRSGRKALSSPDAVMGEIVEFMPMRQDSKNGSRYHLIRAQYGPGVSPAYWRLDTSDWTVTNLSDVQPSGTQGVRYSLGWAALNESIVMGNGYGTQQSGVFPASSATRSIPWLSQYVPGLTGLRFFGLHYHQNLVPAVTYVEALEQKYQASGISVSVSTTGTNYNHISSLAPVNIFAGLYNERSGHYSNGAIVTAGLSTGAPPGTDTILLSGINQAQAPYHNTDEMDEIKVVFYATVQGGNVPYLILNSALDGPFTVDYGTTTNVSLSILNTGSTGPGWVLDFSKRMPVNNYPPRQMRDLCYANGRLWGIIHNWDGIQQTGLEYQIRDADKAGITWSYALGDERLTEFAGDPLQSWDPRHFSPSPSGERPLRSITAPNEVDVVVLTASRTFLVREQAKGLVEWISISQEHGINPNSLRTPARTRYGLCWITQRNQIAILGNDLQLRIISGSFDAVLRDKTLVCGGYVFDPANEVDRYEAFWWSSEFQAPNNWLTQSPSYSICFDFASNSAYTTKSSTVITAIGSVTDADGKQFNLQSTVASSGRAEIYQTEGDPDDEYKVPTVDQDITATSPYTVVDNEIPSASWESNWFSPDSSKRTELVNIDMIGDVCTSDTLGRVPVSIETFRDFGQVVAGQGDLLSVEPIDQSTKSPGTENNYARFRPVDAHGIHWKLRIAHESHSADQGDTYDEPDVDGTNEKNFYGAIVDMKVLIGEGKNSIS